MIELLNENRINNEAVFKRLQEDLESRIPTMGLDEDQEVFIYQKVDETIQNSVAREESVQGVKAAFKEIEMTYRNYYSVHRFEYVIKHLWGGLFQQYELSAPFYEALTGAYFFEQVPTRYAQRPKR